MAALTPTRLLVSSWFSSLSHPPVQRVDSHRQPVLEKIHALGRIEPAGGIIRIGVPVGDRIAVVLVQEGSQVNQGDELARLDSYTEREEAEQLSATQIREADAKLAALRKSYDAQIREAEAHLEELEQLAPLDVQAQEAKVEFLQRQWEAAQRNAAILGSLKEGGMATQEIDQKGLAAFQAEKELKSASALLDRARKSQRYTVQSARASMDMLREARNRAEAEVPLASLKESRRAASLQKARSVILAPVAGTILKVFSHPGEATGSQPLLQMADTSKMVVVAEVYEKDLHLLRKGQPVQVRSPALCGPAGDEVLTGKVTRIGQIIARNNVHDIDPSAEADRRVAEVVIDLDEKGRQAAVCLINLQVDVTIDLGRPAPP